MWNIKLISYLVLMFILTALIVVVRPEMHKPVMFTDKEYQVVEINLPPAQLNPSTIKITPQPVQIESKQIKVSQIPTQTRKVGITPVKQNINKVTSQPVKPQAKHVAHQTQKPQQPVAENKPVTQPPVVKNEQTQKVQQEPKQPRQLTEQEEIIAWNKWLSRLQNQVMMDSKVFAPLGTVFKFSFTVDKYGNMSNVKVWSTNPNYTPQAVRVIKPVLMSYRNQPILEFPEGTKRIIKNFEGSFVISRTTKYSSPSDYHDYERVKH